MFSCPMIVFYLFIFSPLLSCHPSPTTALLFPFPLFTTPPLPWSLTLASLPRACQCQAGSVTGRLVPTEPFPSDPLYPLCLLSSHQLSSSPCHTQPAPAPSVAGTLLISSDPEGMSCSKWLHRKYFQESQKAFIRGCLMFLPSYASQSKSLRKLSLPYIDIPSLPPLPGAPSTKALSIPVCPLPSSSPSSLGSPR